MSGRRDRTYESADGTRTVVLTRAQQRSIDEALRAYRAGPDAARPWSEVRAELAAQRAREDAATTVVPVPVEVAV